MDIGKAIKAVKEGQRVQRAGWHGKDMFIFLIPGDSISMSRHAGPLGMCFVADCIALKTQAGTVQPGWLASQADLLAIDWVIVP